SPTLIHRRVLLRLRTSQAQMGPRLAVFSLLLLLPSLSADDLVPFNFDVCEERVCFASKGCTAQSTPPTELEHHAKSTACDVVLAIWPYTDRKWRVTVQVKSASGTKPEITLQHNSGNTKNSIFECKGSGAA
ncbi:hypothetical protein PFISCL1PPCAC_18984, partial [Pristionchus fissidentatus]